MKRTTIWVPEELWRRFLETVRREGRNASGVLREAIEGYLGVHEPGNPQARMTSFIEGRLSDRAALEGRARERFMRLEECRMRDVQVFCRQLVEDPKAASAMAERVASWLRGRGVRVWR